MSERDSTSTDHRLHRNTGTTVTAESAKVDTETKVGFSKKTKWVAGGLAVAAVMGVGGFFVGKKALDERSDRNAELAAYEAVQAARIERDIRSATTLALLDRAVILKPGTQVRHSPAMLKSAYGGWIQDNVAFTVQPDEVYYVPNPRREKNNGSGDPSAITWLEFTDQTPKANSKPRTPKQMAAQTFDVNLGALLNQEQVVMCDLPETGAPMEGHFNKLGQAVTDDSMAAAYAIRFDRDDLRLLFEQQGINCEGTF